jgi:hypothetical protein
MPNDCSHVDLVVLTNVSVARQNGMRQYFCATANRHGTVDNDVGADVRSRMNIRP